MALEYKTKIDVRKIEKKHLFVGAKGTYLDCALFSNKDGRDDYGQDGFIVQDIPKEAREAGEKGPIIGNWQYHQQTDAAGTAPASAPAENPVDDEDDIPW